MTRIRVSELARQLEPDFDAGRLYWRVAKRGIRKGAEAFTADHNAGYKMGRVNGVGMLKHRVLMALANGEWPEGDVDHINGDRSDNRLCNLRPATRTQNCYNGVGRAGGRTSRFRGVTLHTQTGRWMARCASEYLGLFHSEEEAALAWNTAARRNGGEFARLNDV